MSTSRQNAAAPGARRWLLAFIFLAVCIALLKAFQLSNSGARKVDSGVNGFFTPLVSAVRYVGEGFGSLGQIFRLPALLRENRKMSGEVKLLESQIGEREALEAENEQLRKLMGIELAHPGVIPARVLARPYDMWLTSIILNAGTRRGVSQGDLVVNDEGVVGVVAEKIEGGMCWVTLTTSPSFRLAARTANSGCEGVIAGIDQSTLKLMYIAAGSPVKVNEKVFSSEVTGSPDGAMRPRGLLIGTVKHVAEDVNGFLTIEVDPAFDANKVSNVLIYGQGGTARQGQAQ